MTSQKRSEEGGRAGEAGPVKPEVAAAQTIGVLGAGTMGAGIAQLACVSGARTLLHDPVGEALARGRAGIERPSRARRGTGPPEPG